MFTPEQIKTLRQTIFPYLEKMQEIAEQLQHLGDSQRSREGAAAVADQCGRQLASKVKLLRIDLDELWQR